MSRARLAAFVVLLAAGLPLAVSAQAAPPKKKVLRLDEISVEGRIQKPQAFYILPRQNLNWQGLERNESFLPKIQKSLEEEPF